MDKRTTDKAHFCTIFIVDLYSIPGSVTAACLQMGVSHVGLSTPQHGILQDRWLPNMLMFPSHTCLIHENHHTAMSNAEVNWNFSQSLQICQVKGPDQLPHGRALCQLKVEGAIIWAEAELVSN